MHDFLLAKQIIDSVLEIVKEKRLKKIKSVSLEIGTVNLAHGGSPEHIEEISLENLRFGLENIARNNILKNTSFEIRRMQGRDWKIKEISV